MSGEQYRGRFQVLESPTVWSECRCERKKRRAPPALRTLQKSTAMGVPGITVPLMAGARPLASRRIRVGGAAQAQRATGRCERCVRSAGQC